MKYYLANSDTCANGVTILSTPIIYFISGFLVFAVQIYLIGMLKRSRYLASRHGDKQASNSLILPIYYRGVIYLVILGILVGVDDMFVFYSEYVEIICVKWGLYRMCSESLAIFLTHNGIGIRALYNSLCIGITWAVISVVIPVVIFEYYGWRTYLLVSSFLIILLAVFYGVMWLAPQDYIHRRPAMITYSRFYCIGLTFFALAHYFLLFRDELQLSCLVEVILAFADLLQPLFIFYAMHQDSRFWQGLFTPTYPGEGSTGNLNQPLLGVWELGRETIGVVGESIADLEQHTVPIIPFGILRIDTSGSGYFSGGSARVYKGVLQQEDVAVKILFCIELTPERVVSFCQEASMLHSLQHPNIVHCNGVAVMPPAICLITEWCHHGSLYDLLHVSEYYVRDSSISGRYSISKRTPSQHLTYSRPSLMRMSNLSLENEDLQISNLPDTLIRLEEGAREGGGLQQREGSGKSSNSTEHSPHDRSAVPSARLGSRVVSLKSGSYCAAPPLVNIVLDISTNEVTEINPTDKAEVSLKSRGIMASSMMTKLKSAASVMQSSVMGFGFGQIVPEIKQSPESDSGRSDSRSSLLLTGDSSRHSLGFCLPMSMRMKMVRDCCAGVAFLHSRGLMHCDIKSLNFLVTKDFVVKLSDLGEARSYKAAPVDRIKLPKNINWSAPEILMDNGREVTELSDVWSLAVVAAEILSGEIPFDTQQYRQLTVESFVDALANNIRPTLPPKLPEEIRRTINLAWDYEVAQRCSAQTLADAFTEQMNRDRVGSGNGP